MPTVAPLARAWRFIPARVLSHLEELAYLWQRRRASVYSDSLTLRDFAYLSERLEAHLQGALVAGEALDGMVAELLASTDRDEVFAAAWALLRSGGGGQVRSVLEAFAKARGPALAGFGEALTLVPLAATEATLRAALAHGSPQHAAWAALALAHHGRLDPAAADLAGLLLHEQAEVAELAWRAALCLDTRQAPQARPYAEALRHPDPRVVDAVLQAAVWTGQPWLPDTLRHLAAAPDGRALGWLAALAPPDEQAAVLAQIAARPAAERGPLAARLGSFQALESVLAWMASDDPRLAASATLGWNRMTGLNADGIRGVSPAGDEADPLLLDFPEELVLPDLPKARQQWDAQRARWQAGLRWSRGHDIQGSLSSEAQRWIDLQARWDFGARAALAGQRIIPPPPPV